MVIKLPELDLKTTMLECFLDLIRVTGTALNIQNDV
jgi:hypothetical protein